MFLLCNKISDWTHEKTREYIEIDEKLLNLNNYASGLIGFDYNSAISKTICYEWSKYSKIQDCIAPEGSSRENHRQDQAVLTLLLYRYLFNKSFKRYFYLQTNFIYEVLFHRKKYIILIKNTSDFINQNFINNSRIATIFKSRKYILIVNYPIFIKENCDN